MNDPRVQVVYDDARHFILTTQEKFDIITSDPIDPWVKGAATLYTQRVFRAVQKHLNPGGVVTQWVPLYESNPSGQERDRDILRGLPQRHGLEQRESGKGYDIVLLGQVEPPHIEVDALEERLARPTIRVPKQSLKVVGFDSVASICSEPTPASASDLGPWLANAPDQSRSQPAPAIPRRDGHEFLSRGVHLRRDGEISQISR